MNLYEIDKRINDTIEFCCDLETGELLDDEMLENTLNDLELSKEEKLTNIAKYIKNLTSDAKALQEEKLKFAKRQRITENKIKRLKKYIDDFIRNTQGKDFNNFKFKDVNNTISYRKSQSLEIDDIDKINEDFLKVEKTVRDKKELTKALKNGLNIDGCHLEEKYSLQIK